MPPQSQSASTSTDDIRSLLDATKAPDKVKADAWDAYYQSSSPDEFQRAFEKLNLPRNTKADLWDRKFSRPAVNMGDPSPSIDVSRSSPGSPEIKPSSHSSADPSAWERFAHAAGLPASTSEILPVLRGIAFPEARPEDIGTSREVLQTLPLVGGAFRAQRETYESPDPWGKVYGLIPLLGPPGHQMGQHIENGDWAAATGSAINIITQLMGMRAGLRGPEPGTVEAAAASRGLPAKVVTPYQEGAAVSPAATVVGGPKGMTGRYLADRLGLKTDYADRIAKRVDEIQKAREQQVADVQRVNAEAAEGKQFVEQQSAQAKAAVESATSNLISDLNKQIETSRSEQMATGKHLLADTAKAVWEEQQRVRKPFQEIAETISDAQVASVGDIRKTIVDSIRDAGGNPHEVPNAAYKALPHGKEAAAAAGAAAEDFIDSPEGMQSTKPVTFDTLNRVREDLWNEAVRNKDSAVKRGLYSAHDQITELQEHIADQFHQGDKYRAAKRDYMLFKRGIGGSMVEKWLSAKSMDEQAVLPKISKLLTRGVADKLRPILKSVGIDAKPLDELIASEEAARAGLKEAPKAAAAQIKNIEAEAKQRIGDIESGQESTVKEIGKTTESAVNPAQEYGGKVVKGKTSEELAGLSNEQINRQRLQAAVDDMQRSGISSPGALVQILYGLTLAVRGIGYGFMHIGRGISMESLPSVFRSPGFQEWVLDRAGVVPGSKAAAGVRTALNDLAKEAAVETYRRTQGRKRPAVAVTGTAGAPVAQRQIGQKKEDLRKRIEAVMQDTSQARQELGPDASVTAVAERAKQLQQSRSAASVPPPQQER